MKTLKIDNPRWFALYMTPHIKRYSDKVNIPGITYESLVTSIAQVIQFGGDRSEFWTAFDDDDKPVGFAVWSVMQLPYIGTVFLHHLHAWDKGKFGISKALVAEFIEFAKRSKCTLFRGDALNEAAYRLFSSIADKNGGELIKLDTIPFTGRFK